MSGKFDIYRSRCGCKYDKRSESSTPCCSWLQWWAHGWLPSFCNFPDVFFPPADLCQWNPKGLYKFLHLGWKWRKGMNIWVPDCLQFHYRNWLYASFQFFIYWSWVINLRQQCDEDIGVCATRKWKAHTCNGKGILDSHGAPAAIYNTTSIYPSVADSSVDCRMQNIQLLQKR